MPLFARIVAVLLGLAVLYVFVGQPWERMPPDAAPAAEQGHETPEADAPAIEASKPDAPKPAAPAQPAVTVQKPAEPTPAAPVPGEAKAHLLAREQAEQDRSATLEERHAITPEPRPSKVYYKVKVRDGATLEAVSTGSPGTGAPAATSPAPDAPRTEPPPRVIRLEGIAVREVGTTCLDGDGLAWPCGARARAALVKLIHSRAVTCTLPPGGETPDFAARCSVAGTDLSLWMVRQGWAEPKPGAERALADALKAAKDARLGIWRGGEE